MLVLSRRPDEKIVFPTIGVTVQVVGVKPGVVRLGIDAPPSVTVLREEVLQRTLQAGQAAALQPPPDPMRQISHIVRNRLNSTTIGLALLRRQLQAGLRDGLESTLSRIDQELQALRDQVEVTLETPPPSLPNRRRKALLVEDDRNECELLAGFLRLAGLEVDTAGDGCDALDYLHRSERPDVILLDMILPRCDGLSTVRAIRKEPALAGLKIFAVTGSSPAHFPMPQGPEGVDRWFAKPLNPEALLRELHRELETTP